MIEPASVREHRYFVSLGEMDRQDNPNLPADVLTPRQVNYNVMKRAAQIFDTGGGGKGAINYIPGSGSGSSDKAQSTTQEPLIQPPPQIPAQPGMQSPQTQQSPLAPFMPTQGGSLLVAPSVATARDALRAGAIQRSTELAQTTPDVIAGAAARAQAEAEATKTGTGMAERALDLPAARAEMRQTVATFDRMQKHVDEIVASDDLWKAVGIGRGLSKIPSSAGADVAAVIASIKSEAGLITLQMLRNMSKTGGAVGNVTDFEQRLFQDYLEPLSSVDQSPEAFRERVRSLTAFLNEQKEINLSQFRETYPGIEVDSVSASGAAFDMSNMSDEELRRIAEEE
jgi:hypothetical protein